MANMGWWNLSGKDNLRIFIEKTGRNTTETSMSGTAEERYNMLIHLCYNIASQILADGVKPDRAMQMLKSAAETGAQIAINALEKGIEK